MVCSTGHVTLPVVNAHVPLPIDAVLPEVLEALRTKGAAVLLAPPGAGKTTRVPPAILDADLCPGQRILVLQPRRVAARAAAHRVAAIGKEGGDYRPLGRCVDERAIVNAIVGLLATGGSMVAAIDMLKKAF